MPIQVDLDKVMQDQKVSLTELAARVDLTLANLSILKTNKAWPSASAPWRRFAAS